tara:strand:- start:358 stop:2037 length:1680 start_codon:yes stop_codon:yes gene_type:complete
MKGKTEGQDIWYSDRDENGNWGKPNSFLRANNPKVTNAVIGISKDASKVYVFQNEYKKKKIDLKLTYTSRIAKNQWSDLKKLDVPGLNLVDGYYSFYITPNEDILMISMAPADTNAFEDLYVSLKGENDKWSELIYLGDVVNTPDYDVTPFLAKDKKTLYFASNGHGGLGESDIFVTYRLDNTWKNWTKPVNLGAPINSEGYDAYLAIDNNEVFFTSNRNQDYSDIYYSQIKEDIKFVGNEEYVKVNAKYMSGGLPSPGVRISVYDIKGDLVDDAETDENGLFFYTKLNPKDLYYLKINEEDLKTYPKAKIYGVDENGNSTKRFGITAENLYTLEESKIVFADQVNGALTLQNKPKSQEKLVVFDANNFRLDTVTTDSKGVLHYNKMVIDDLFYFQSLSANTEGDNSAELVFLDPFGKQLFNAEKDPTNRFVFDGKKNQEAMNKNTANLLSNGFTILFDFGSSSLTINAINQLSSMIKVIDDRKSTKVQLVGHADERDSESVNMEVSRRRAEVVKQYLISQGFAEKNIKTSAKGESTPVASNSTEEGRAKNRRVEINFN